MQTWNRPEPTPQPEPSKVRIAVLGLVFFWLIVIGTIWFFYGG